MENISEYITYAEATQSPTATKKKIKNVPDEATLYRMKVVAEECFEPIRKWYNKPIKINSFYRSLELNKAVGGSANSQHCKGEAIDISAGSKEENKKLFDWCKANLDFDQLLNEYDYTWVHISFKSKGNRYQVLDIK